METKINTASMNMAILNRAQVSSVMLSNNDVKPQGVSTNFRDAIGRIIRTKDGLIFKVRE